MNIDMKLEILTESAKYDASCSSSGVEGGQRSGNIGSTAVAGCCHSFSADGRCISLLKVLLTNVCVFDCHYCINRKSNSIRRATFTPEEIAQLTIDFYRRNYIEGLFLSSSIIKNPDYTCELMIKALELLRHHHGFAGYIHVKAIPGADSALIDRLALLADRLSSNIELPSQKSLALLAPDKSPQAVVKPMKQIAQRKQELALIGHQRKAQRYAPAGQSTQMIIGATPDSDYQILQTSAALYDKFQLKRVYFSAYIPTVAHTLLPSLDTKPPLLREHRLYQADWLMRFYQFNANEILTPEQPNFNLYIDPKANWAIQHYDQFPIDVQRADLSQLLRIPGIGPTSARRIIERRKHRQLDYTDLVQTGAVMKRAKYFVACKDYLNQQPISDPTRLIASLMSAKDYQQLKTANTQSESEQLSLFDAEYLAREKQREVGISG